MIHHLSDPSYEIYDGESSLIRIHIFVYSMLVIYIHIYYIRSIIMG